MNICNMCNFYKILLKSVNLMKYNHKIKLKYKIVTKLIKVN